MITVTKQFSGQLPFIYTDSATLAVAAEIVANEAALHSERPEVREFGGGVTFTFWMDDQPGVNRLYDAVRVEGVTAAQLRNAYRAAHTCASGTCRNTVHGGARFCSDCSEWYVAEIEAEAAAETAEALEEAAVLNDGTYTLVYDNDRYFTFRVRELTSGRLSGRRVVEYLNGSDNELDFQAFGFVNRATINVWNRFERGHLVNRAREIERLARNDREGLEAAGVRYAERSSRCRRCNRVLTVPASIHAGFGPDCAAQLGVAYGHAEPGATRRSTQRARREEPVVAEPIADANACPSCGGEGCDMCNETGRVLVASPVEDTSFEDRAADRYDARHFSGEPGFGYAI